MTQRNLRILAVFIAANLAAWLYAEPSKALVLSGSAAGTEEISVYDFGCHCFVRSSMPAVVSFSVDTSTLALDPTPDPAVSFYVITAGSIAFSIGGYMPQSYDATFVEVNGSDLSFVANLFAGNAAGVDVSGLSLTDLVNPNPTDVSNIVIESAEMSAIHEGGYYEFWTPASGAPEPAAWALMLLGVGLTGGLLRLRAEADCGFTRLPIVAA